MPPPRFHSNYKISLRRASQRGSNAWDAWILSHQRLCALQREGGLNGIIHRTSEFLLALPVSLRGNMGYCKNNEETANLVLLTISLTSRHKSVIARQAAVQTPEAEPILRAKQLLDVGLRPRPVCSVHITHRTAYGYAKICEVRNTTRYPTERYGPSIKGQVSG